MLGSRLLRLLACASRLLNRIVGGHTNQTLCARAAFRFGSRCLFCRIVGAVLNDPDHCADELRWWLFKD